MSAIDAIPDCIPPGSIAKCVDRFNEVMTGEVLVYDRVRNVLLLSTSQPNKQSKFHLINLSFVKSFELLKDTCTATALPSLANGVNRVKISRRIKEETSRKAASFCSPECPMEGRRLFVAIKKTIDDVRWSKESIEVFQSVLVHPPYTSQSIQIKETHETVRQAQSTLEHVKKIVERFWRNSEIPSEGVVKTIGHEEQPSTETE